MTSVTATFQDSKIAAVVADSVVKKLQEYIIDYRTSKSKEDCLYLEKLFKERQQEYYVAQKKYADYMDSHDNIILQSVRTEQERLQNDMSLAYVYTVRLPVSFRLPELKFRKKNLFCCGRTCSCTIISFGNQ